MSHSPNKAKVKLVAAVTAGAAGATAGPLGAMAAVAASQLLVDGAYNALAIANGQTADPEILTEEPQLEVGEAIMTHEDGSRQHYDAHGNIRDIRDAQ